MPSIPPLFHQQPTAHRQGPLFRGLRLLIGMTLGAAAGYFVGWLLVL